MFVKKMQMVVIGILSKLIKVAKIIICILLIALS